MRLFLAAVVFCAAAAPVAASPFEVYRAACLDTAADRARVRIVAANQGWAALTEPEREKLAPGNSAALEGWAVVRQGTRHLVSVSVFGDPRDESQVASCYVLSPVQDEPGILKLYSGHMKRPPGSQERFEGTATYVWSEHGAGFTAMHYFVTGGVVSGSSLSISVIRK